MDRLLAVLAVVLLCLSNSHAADEPAKKAAQKGKPGAAPFPNATPERLLKRLDKNNDGYLSKDEVPPRLAQFFDKADRNGDGKLDRAEIAQMLETARKLGGPPGTPPPAGKGGDDQFITRLLERMDTNKDGKISKAEAQGPLADNFERLDTNKDGFLDKKELAAVAARMKARQGQGGPGGRPGGAAASIPDFDAFDANADGRLDRDEVKGKPFADKFAEIDTNKDGKIDRKEFAAYFKKQAEKKEAERKEGEKK